MRLISPGDTAPLSSCLGSVWDLHNRAGDGGQRAAMLRFIIHPSLASPLVSEPPRMTQDA